MYLNQYGALVRWAFCFPLALLEQDSAIKVLLRDAANDKKGRLIKKHMQMGSNSGLCCRRADLLIQLAKSRCSSRTSLFWSHQNSLISTDSSRRFCGDKRDKPLPSSPDISICSARFSASKKSQMKIGLLSWRLDVWSVWLAQTGKMPGCYELESGARPPLIWGSQFWGQHWLTWFVSCGCASGRPKFRKQARPGAM